MTFTPLVLVFGRGRLGSRLATRLERAGYATLVFEEEARALGAVPSAGGGDRLAGGALDLGRLRSAQVLAAVTAHDDANLAMALVAERAFGVGWLLARIEDPARAGDCRELGIEPVCPPVLAADALLEDVAARCAQDEDLHGDRMKRSLFVVVVGCGRLGSHLANQLSRAGHSVVVIDREAASFGGLSPEAFSGFRLEGDAAEFAILKRAKMDRADLVIAATREDNLNIMVALVARKVFGVKEVMARVYDPRREHIYRELGLETVCPTAIATEAFFRLVEKAAGKPGGSGA